MVERVDAVNVDIVGEKLSVIVRAAGSPPYCARTERDSNITGTHTFCEPNLVDNSLPAIWNVTEIVFAVLLAARTYAP